MLQFAKNMKALPNLKFGIGQNYRLLKLRTIYLQSEWVGVGQESYIVERTSNSLRFPGVISPECKIFLSIEDFTNFLGWIAQETNI